MTSWMNGIKRDDARLLTLNDYPVFQNRHYKEIDGQKVELEHHWGKEKEFFLVLGNLLLQELPLKLSEGDVILAIIQTRFTSQLPRTHPLDRRRRLIVLFHLFQISSRRFVVV